MQNDIVSIYAPHRHGEQHAPHGIIPDKLTLKVIDHFSNHGHDHIVDHMLSNRSYQSQRMMLRDSHHRTIQKGLRNLLPDGQIINVYSSENRQALQFKLKRSDPTVNADPAVNEAYDGAVATYSFLKTVCKINSIDNHHFPLISNVHFSKNYDNAYWDGEQMVYGDGDGKVFARFTKDIDVSAHEQSHGMTQDNAGTRVSPKGKPTGINYEGEAGGINEGYSDIFGIMVKQFKNNQLATDSNWLLGEHLILPYKGHTYALRSMLHPGTGFVNHPVLGTDSQIGNYADYLHRSGKGSVDPHDSSGIVNKAFAAAAITLQGHSWDVLGPLFFATLPDVVPNETFAGLAQKTIAVAKTTYKERPEVERALLTGWRASGVLQ